MLLQGNSPADVEKTERASSEGVEITTLYCLKERGEERGRKLHASIEPCDPFSCKSFVNSATIVPGTTYAGELNGRVN